MDLQLKNRVALVTGSSRGIGKAIALSLAREGTVTIVCGQEQEAVNKAKLEIELCGVAAHSFVLDARNKEEVKTLFSTTVEKIGQLDILVNNIGGIKEFSRFPEVADEQWHDAFNFNFMTAVHFVREAIPWLKKSDNARIINISSVAGKQPGAFNPHYGAVKAALIHLSKYLANDLARDNILVNVLCPSTITGETFEQNIQDRSIRSGLDLERAKELIEGEIRGKTPLGKIGAPEDVADLVVFLASDKAKFITGVCICVDGGTVRSIF